MSRPLHSQRSRHTSCLAASFLPCVFLCGTAHNSTPLRSVSCYALPSWNYLFCCRVSAHSACRIMPHYKTWPIGFPRSPRHNQVMSPSSALYFFLKPSSLVALCAARSIASGLLVHHVCAVARWYFSMCCVLGFAEEWGVMRAPRALACSTPLQNILICYSFALLASPRHGRR